MPARCAETLDSILGGRVRVIQPRDGYRFSVDAVLLARFAGARPKERVLELGAGCGVVSLIIAELGSPSEVCAVEIQPELAQLVARNAALNGLGNLRAVCCDLRQLQSAGLKSASFDLVVANPPYHARHRGRESPNPSRRLARGGAGARAEEFLAAASQYARHGGRVAMVFSAGRAAEFIALMCSMGLEPKRIRFVHPRLDLPAASILIEARKGGGIEAKIEPPLILYKDKGVYSEEAMGLLTRP